jgi:hypothetical protein
MTNKVVPSDILIHSIAFGGRAFEPLTDAGRAWCRDVRKRNNETDGYPVFRPGDACMTGFDNPAFGCEPCDFDAFAEDIIDAGLTAALS